MKPLLLIYRVLYGAYLALVLAVLTRLIYFRGRVRMPEIVPLSLYALTVAFVLFATIGFKRVPARLVWAGTVLLCGFFTWYAWYSLEAPFVLREMHTFDPMKAAIEKSRVEMRAAIVYALLMIWYLSLPVLRTAYEKRLKARL